MSTTRRLAVSYSRFSDFKQAKGDSTDRQERLFRDFCERHNLTPLAEVFADRGRSGYKDEHRKKGRLGQLAAMAKDGRFEPNTVIVVEAWDRLGRLRPDKMTQLVAELVQHGLGIGVCRLDDIFTEEDFGTHKWTTLAVFIQLAYQESKQKADRVAASWEKRREQAREGKGAVNKERDGRLRLGRIPAWLENTGDGLRLIPQRAAVVRRIFQMAGSGHGRPRIVGALTREGVEPFGERKVNEGRGRSQFSGKWTAPYVALILNDRRAVGEMQPRKADGTPDGPPLAGYYPAAVTEKEFLRARAGQAERLGRDKIGRALTARQSKHVNTFRGLLRHARDGEGFTLSNRDTAEKASLILANATGMDGRGRCYTIPYRVFEDSVLGRLKEVDPREVMPDRQEQSSLVDTLRAQLSAVRQDMAGLKADLADGYSKALASLLRDKEATEERLAQELQDELAKGTIPAERAWAELPGLVDMIREGGDDARLKLRTVLRRVIDEIQVLIVPIRSYRLVAVQVWFAGGEKQRSYLVLHQPKANRRPGGTWVRSFADVAKGKCLDLDLRKRKDAAKLARLLESHDPAGLGGAAHNQATGRRPR